MQIPDWIDLRQSLTGLRTVNSSTKCESARVPLQCDGRRPVRNMFGAFVIPLAVCASLVVVWAGAGQVAHASDYSHTCRVEGGSFVIDDGSLYETAKYKSGSPGEPLLYRVVSETPYSDERGYCISWSDTAASRYEFRSRRYIQRIEFNHAGQLQEREARCALYADGMPAKLDCDRRVVTERVGEPERRAKGWGIDDEREETTSRWMHNGSEMELRADEDSRIFSYVSPRVALAPFGVRSGSVLFDGQLVDGKLEGRARIFTKLCGEISFPVRGTVERGGTRIVLRGKAPIMTAACRPEGTKDSELVFAAKAPPIAGGGGSLPFEEAVEFVKGDARLIAQVAQLLSDAKTDMAAIVCVGAALGDQWQHLSRTRIPPFECQIGKSTLLIEGAVEFLDVDGKVVGRTDGGSAGPPSSAFKSATSVRFVRPRWHVRQ